MALLHCCTAKLLRCCAVELLHCCTVVLLHCCNVAMLPCSTCVVRLTLPALLQLQLLLAGLRRRRRQLGPEQLARTHTCAHATTHACNSAMRQGDTTRPGDMQETTWTRQRATDNVQETTWNRRTACDTQRATDNRQHASGSAAASKGATDNSNVQRATYARPALAHAAAYNATDNRQRIDIGRGQTPTAQPADP